MTLYFVKRNCYNKTVFLFWNSIPRCIVGAKAVRHLRPQASCWSNLLPTVALGQLSALPPFKPFKSFCDQIYLYSLPTIDFPLSHCICACGVPYRKAVRISEIAILNCRMECICFLYFMYLVASKSHWIFLGPLIV